MAVHIYTQTTHRTTQITTNVEECGPCPVFASFILAFALQLRKKHGNTSVMFSVTLSLTSALDGGGWLTTRPGRFAPGNDAVPIVHEAGRVSGPIWTGAENLAPARIRSPDRPSLVSRYTD